MPLQRGVKSVPNQVSRTLLGTNRKKRLYVWKKQVPPAGFEQLLQHTGITHDCKQGGTESGTVGESTRLVQLFEILATLTNHERETLMSLLEQIRTGKLHSDINH